MEPSLNGKKVAITGAAGSIGQTLVQNLVKHGCIVYAISRTSSKLEELAKSCTGIIPILCDISNWEEAEKTLTTALPDDLDALINNAGVAKTETLEELTAASIDEMMNVNIKGTLCTTKVVAKKMTASGKGGCIVNMSSVSSDFPCTFLLTYSMTKAAMNRLTKTLATQLGPQKIRVNSVNPTMVTDTNMGDSVFDSDEKLMLVNTYTPLRPFPTSQDVSDSVIFLLSDKAKCITGQIIFVDSGIHGG